MVAAGMADQQIWDALYLDSIVSEDLEASRAHELYVQTHLRLIHGSPERHLSVMKRPVGRTRARLLTDVREAMHHAIADIGQTKLTWTNVAMKISMLYPAIVSLDESTLRRWAKAEKLPPPWDPSWRTR
jgi:S-adenosylmethionine synthetase